MTRKKNKKKEQPVLGLRTCNADMTSYGGFVWPTSGQVTCPDWNPEPVCGGGLHFLPWGEGNGELLDWSKDAVWLVVRAEKDIVIIDDEKAKAQTVEVVYCGDRNGATSFIAQNGGLGRVIVGGTATAGNRGTATAGNRGTATAGDAGTATAGDRGTATAGDAGTATAGYAGTATAGYAGTATAGDRGTATAGDEGTATAGNRGTATAGDRGTATAGDEGTATAGNRGTATAGDAGTATAGDEGTATAGYTGTATAGDRGTATAGDEGTATAGYAGTAIAGDRGTATAGDEGTIIIKRWDGKRYKFSIGYIGEDGLLPGVTYRLDDNGNFVRVDQEAK
jgi:hypothetical protein